MSGRTALIYSPGYDRYSFGTEHPFQIKRYELAFELLNAYGLTQLPGTLVCEAGQITDQILLNFHSADYLARLKEFSSAAEPRADFLYGLGDAENPVFNGVYDWACLGTAGTVTATRLVQEKGFMFAFNLAGGWHHAHKSKASGFSYINDVVVAINELLRQRKRVAYLDLDAHHGDGVQEAFYNTDQVLTISLHESGVYFFPGTGFEKEIGTGRGVGYTVNVPLMEHSDDAIYIKAFDEVALPLIAAYDPDILITQMGADTFRTDPLSRIEITTHAYSYITRKLRALEIPWVAVGGGGYDAINVARAWTIVWAIMNDQDLPSDLPPSFVDRIRTLGYKQTALLDRMHWAEDDDRNRALDAIEKTISSLKKAIFPIVFG